ncbi:MAG: META domain-containing protein [Woeseiaceae bacterium]|nr:META domain-containing protein [Woeseiaceae bacterium]
MRARFVLIASSILALCASATYGEPLRYRGEYTYGHEVNIFCPAINSQCYWLSADTPGHVREKLKKLAAPSTSKPYEPICVVIEAEIDRETRRDGFAADYDGLITVTHLFGVCNETDIVTDGDLQHHRWILESINGEAVDVDALEGRIPELDFGEQMHVSGNSGCNRFSGRASLHDRYIRFGQLISTLMTCSPAQNEIEYIIQQVLAGSKIKIRINNNDLLLDENDVSLRYQLQDWIE